MLVIVVFRKFLERDSYLADMTGTLLNGHSNLEASDSSTRIGASPAPVAGGGLSTLSRKSGMN